MRLIAKMFSFAALMLAAVSCLFENDMSYPRAEMDILAFEVKGQKSVNIDAAERHVEIVLGESVDLSHVAVLDIAVSEGAEILGGIPEFMDLRDPDTLVLKTYVEAVWTVSAVQPIERYIEVENQVGEAEINVENRSAVVYVAESQSLKNVVFNAVKLEREGSVVVSTTGTVTQGEDTVEETLPCEFPMTLECVMLRKFNVEYDGETFEWIVRVLQKEIEVEITSVNAWARHAYVTAVFDGSGEPYMEYRRSDASEWTRVDGAKVTGVGISADISGLTPETAYAVRVVNGSLVSGERSFTTEAAAQIPNMTFDDWYAADPSASKAVWYPYATAANQAWDSANPGAATFIGSSTVPEEAFVVKGKAACMESKYAVIAFAAGNIYTGKFVKLAGVGAELDWGYPFTSRPTSLKGYYNYTPKPIDKADDAMSDKLGTIDKCQIQVFLADWSAPFHVNTSKGQFVDLDGDDIIAYGKLETDEATGSDYKEFTIDLEYRSTTLKPAYVVISACASYLGDYFTGGVGSKLYVDEFEFIY